MTYFIVKSKDHRFGKTRSEQDSNLRREGWGSSFSSEEARDKCKFLEKRGLPFPSGADIEKVR